MTSVSPEFLLCLALALAATAFLQWPYGWRRKTGLLLLAVTIALTIGIFTHSIQVGIAVFLTLLVWPVVAILSALRRFRVHRERKLVNAFAPDDFGELPAMTLELSNLGFRHVDQCELEPNDDIRAFFRFFVHNDDAILAMLVLESYADAILAYASFSSVDEKDQTWVTSDHPGASGLKVPPGFSLYRASHCESLEELLDSHRSFLRLNDVADKLVRVSETSADARSRLERNLQQQIDFNLGTGILELTGNENKVRYSWRGTFFAAGKLLRELVLS